ncbi:unnamed protein product [Caenorhabditis nigoni]
MKRLSTLLGSKFTHVVEALSVKNMDSILGLPRNIKLQANSFVLYDDTEKTYEVLRKWVQPSSFPLKEIGMEIESPFDEVFNNMVTASDCNKLSVFLPMCATGPGEWADPFIRLQHPFIKIQDHWDTRSDCSFATSMVFPNVFLLPISGSKSLELVISGSKSPYFEKELLAANPVLWMFQMEVKEQQQQGFTRGN